MSVDRNKRDSGTPTPPPGESTGEQKRVDQETAKESVERRAKDLPPKTRLDALVEDAQRKRQEIDRALAEAEDAVDLLGEDRVEQAKSQLQAIDDEQAKVIDNLGDLFSDLNLDDDDGGSKPLEVIENEPAGPLKEIDEDTEQLTEADLFDVIETEDAAVDELDEDTDDEVMTMAERIDQQLREQEMAEQERVEREQKAEQEKAWEELDANGATPTVIKKIAKALVQDPSQLGRLDDYGLPKEHIIQILKRASEDSLDVANRLGQQADLQLEPEELLEIMSNRTDFENWKTTWNLTTDTIRDAQPDDDIESQLIELGEMLSERPDRLELLFGAGEMPNSAKALDGLSLLQRQTISERLRAYRFTDNEENIAVANALVLEHPDRFRDIYNTLPVSKKQTEQLLSSIPEGEAREKAMKEMGLKIDQTKFDAGQVEELTAKYEKGPEQENQAIIEALRESGRVLYEAAQQAPPEIAAQFTSGPAFEFADVSIRNSGTAGKKMADVAGPMLQAQRMFEQAIAKAEQDPNFTADISELKAALARHAETVEQTRLAAEKELAEEFEQVREARQELYEAIKEENPDMAAYIEERQRIEERLHGAKLTEVQDLGNDSGITAPTRNYFEGMTLPAVGKAASKELRAIQTPETYSYGYSIKAESMTTDLAVALGKTNVVPSVDRVGPEGATNFQEWYPSEALSNIPWGDVARRNEDFAAKLEDVVEVRALARDIDGHAGNMKRTPNGEIVTIDHGQAFTSARPEQINNEPYNYFRCYASWAVGGRQMRSENKRRMHDLFNSPNQKKTREALQKLFRIRFGQEAPRIWKEMQERAEKMMAEGLPQNESSPHPTIQEYDKEALDAAYVAGSQS